MSIVNLDRVLVFYHKYIQKVAAAETLQNALQSQQEELHALLNAIPEEKWMHKYNEDKWTIKEVVQHMMDAERIFCYRALCFARNEKAALPGFDENEYTIASNANARTKKSLVHEFITIQSATLSLFNSFTIDQLNANGIANCNPIYVEAIGYIIAGHARHHMSILNERYL